MNFSLKMLSVAVIFSLSLDSYTMMKEMDIKDSINDTAIGVPALSRRLQQINLRDYNDPNNEKHDAIKKEWYNIIEGSLQDWVAGPTYKDLMPLFKHMKQLTDELFNAVDKGNDNFKIKKEAIERLVKTQSEVKRFLLGQKAKSFFSFGKKQDDYKKVRQLLLGMIDVLNGKIDAIKKSVK